MSKRKPERIKRLRNFVGEQFEMFSPARVKKTTKILESRGKRLYSNVQRRAPQGKATLKRIVTKNIMPRAGRAVKTTIREAVNPDERRK